MKILWWVRCFEGSAEPGTFYLINYLRLVNFFMSGKVICTSNFEETGTVLTTYFVDVVNAANGYLLGVLQMWFNYVSTKTG